MASLSPLALVWFPSVYRVRAVGVHATGPPFSCRFRAAPPLAWRCCGSAAFPSPADPYATVNVRKLTGDPNLPTNQGVLVGSYESVARMLDEVATVPGVQGVMLTFDEFVSGVEKFGTRIQPLMQSRREKLATLVA